MDSDDGSTDDGRGRKRMGEDMEGHFMKSKKTSRTPTKTQNKEEDKLDQILSLIKDIKLEQREIKNEVKQLRAEQKEINEAMVRMQRDNETIKKENEEIKMENKAIKQELRTIKDTVEKLEKERKKNNVVISGLVTNTNDPKAHEEITKDFIKNNLKINVEIKSITKINEKTNIIELKNEKHKKEVMRNKAKLKNLGTTERIYINEDMTKKEREKQKQIRSIAKVEKEKGKNVKIGYNKVIVDGIEWKWNKDKEEIENPYPKN